MKAIFNTPCARAVLFSFLAICLVVIKPIQVTANELTDFADCYGDRLDVVFPSVTAGDGELLPEVNMALPSPKAWLVITTEQAVLSQLPCQAEPIEVRRATILGIDPRLGHAAIPAEEGIRIQMIKLSRISIGKEQFVANQSRGAAIGFEKDSQLVQGGYLRRIGADKDAISGSWLFPDSYRSPFGVRIKMGCATVCRTSYGLDAERSILVSYRFFVNDHSRRPDWVAIDQSIRKLVDQWMN